MSKELRMLTRKAHEALEGPPKVTLAERQELVEETRKQVRAEVVEAQARIERRRVEAEEDATLAESPTLQSYYEGQFSGLASALSILASCLRASQETVSEYPSEAELKPISGVRR